MASDSQMTVTMAHIIVNNTPNEVRARIDAILKTRHTKDLAVTFGELNAIRERLDQTKRALLFLRNHDPRDTEGDLPPASA